MAGKAEDDKVRSRKLLSQDAVPKVEIPRRRTREKRQFKLPDEISAPIPRRKAKSDADADAERPPKRRKRSSTARFKERTLGWFKTGEELEEMETATPEQTGEKPPEPSSPLPMLVIVGGAVALAVTIVVVWLT